MRLKLLGLPAVVFYAAMIVLANYVTTRVGLISVGFGLLAPAGTYFIGAAIVARNLTQETLGRWLVIAAIGAGALLSWFIASPALAVASAVAFLSSEFADFLIYTFIRSRASRANGWALAAIGGDAVAAVVDSLIFLTLAGFPVLAVLPGQLVGKFYATVFYVVVGLLIRRGVASKALA